MKALKIYPDIPFLKPQPVFYRLVTDFGHECLTLNLSLKLSGDYKLLAMQYVLKPSTTNTYCHL